MQCGTIIIHGNATTLCTHRTPPRKKIKRSSTPVGELELEIIKELRRGQSTPSADEDDLFGQSVAATLKNIPPQQKALAKMRMQQLLYEVQFCTPQPYSAGQLQLDNSPY